jgi:hypothetical protein
MTGTTIGHLLTWCEVHTAGVLYLTQQSDSKRLLQKHLDDDRYVVVVIVGEHLRGPSIVVVIG